MAFAVCLKVLAFGIALCVLVFGVMMLILLPQFIYQIPYYLWCGAVNADEQYPVTKDSGILRNNVYATKLYKHWILHTELDF